MGREAVHDRRHRVLTYPEEDLFAIGMLTGLTILTFEKRSRVTREIGTATDEAGDDIDQCGQDLTRGGTCGDLGSHVEFWKRIAPIVGRRDRRSGGDAVRAIVERVDAFLPPVVGSGPFGTDLAIVGCDREIGRATSEL